MKGLDRTKAYDLRNLNDEQKSELLEWLQKEEPNSNWGWFSSITKFLYYNKEWYETHTTEGREEYFKVIINALTLFEPQLKVCDTFEKDGFICRVESEVMKWYVVGRGLDAYYIILSEDEVLWRKAEDVRVTEITNQEFIKQLEYHLDV